MLIYYKPFVYLLLSERYKKCLQNLDFLTYELPMSGVVKTKILQLIKLRDKFLKKLDFIKNLSILSLLINSEFFSSIKIDPSIFSSDKISIMFPKYFKYCEFSQ